MESILQWVRGTMGNDPHSTDSDTYNSFHNGGELKSRASDSEPSSDPPRTESSTDYEYDCIDKTSGTIRLLSLSHQTDGKIYGELRTVNISECPPFIALSYRWEPRYPIQYLYLNGGELEIGKNLYDALYAILSIQQSRNDAVNSSAPDHNKRPRGDDDDDGDERPDENSPPRGMKYSEVEAQDTTMRTLEQCPFFWIDAISINQTNVVERNHQVGLMKQIYSEAALVLLWLGEESDNSNTAMSLLRDTTFGKTKKVDRRGRKALEELFSKPYWKRLWIVQELVLARAIVVVCGSEKILWRDLFAFQSPAKKLLLTEASISLPEVVNLWSTHQEWRAVSISLEYLIERFSDYECADPRDKVFGLLSLVRGIDPMKPMFTIEADYAMTTEEVCSCILYGLRDHGRMRTRRIASYDTRRTETGKTLWEFEDILRSALRLPSLRSSSWISRIFGTEQYKEPQPWVFPGSMDPALYSRLYSN